MTQYPQEGELVIATVTKIHYHSIFCNLDEYKGVSGMLHISEVAPGRIRNINEYVKEGKVIIVKVLRVDENKGHVDLSLRRVTEAQRKQKAASRKRQALVENIITQVSKTANIEEKDVYKQLEPLGEIEDVYDAFVEVVEQEDDLSSLNFDSNIQEVLVEAIQERIKPKQVSIKSNITIKSYAPDGAEQIRKAFSNVPKEVDVYYSGAGVYTTTITAKEYKVAEETQKGFLQQLKDDISDAEISLERVDK